MGFHEKSLSTMNSSLNSVEHPQIFPMAIEAERLFLDPC